jgi:hypothetical protein
MNGAAPAGCETRSWVGGARIDAFNATWPFARLTATRDVLRLRVVWAGVFEFRPDQVDRLGEFGFIPFLGKGVQIHHHVASYPSRIVFWHLSWSVVWLIEELHRFGYGGLSAADRP